LQHFNVKIPLSNRRGRYLHMDKQRSGILLGGCLYFFLRATHPLTVSLSDTVTPDLGSEIMERCKSRIGFRIHLSDWNVLNPFAHKILVQFLSVSYSICKLIYLFLIYLFFNQIFFLTSI